MRILQQKGWNLYLLMRQRAVPNRKKPGNTTGYLTQTERRTKVRLGQADAAADTVDEQAAAALKATWSLVLSSCCVLWIDNWYRAQYTTHPDESDRSQTTQNYIDAQITEQWVIFHLDHPDNTQHVNQTAGMRQCRSCSARGLAHFTTFVTSVQLPMRRSEQKSQHWARRN